MNLTAKQVTEVVSGELQGDAEKMVRGVAPLSEATEDELSFISDPKYFKEAASSKAGV